MASKPDRVAATIKELSKLINDVAARHRETSTDGFSSDSSGATSHRAGGTAPPWVVGTAAGGPTGSTDDASSTGARGRVPRNGRAPKNSGARSDAAKDGESPSPEAQRARAREIALRRLDRRDYSRAEMISYLVGKREVDADIAAEIIDRFIEVGIVDDARFARNWAVERIRTRRLSRNAIRRELAQRGVGDEAISEALEQISGDQERQAAIDLCRTKAARMRGVDRERAIRRLSAQLARRGYPTGLSVSVVLQVLDEQELADDDDQ